MFEGLLGTIGSGLLWATGIALVVALIYSFFNKDKSPDGQNAPAPDAQQRQRVVEQAIPQKVLTVEANTPRTHLDKFAEGVTGKNLEQLNIVRESLPKTGGAVGEAAPVMNKIKNGTQSRYEFMTQVPYGKLVEISQAPDAGNGLRKYIPDAKDDEVANFKKWGAEIQNKLQAPQSGITEGAMMTLDGRDAMYPKLVTFISTGKYESAAPAASTPAATPAASTPAATPAASTSAAAPAASTPAATPAASTSAAAPAASTPAAASATPAPVDTLPAAAIALKAELKAVVTGENCSALNNTAGLVVKDGEAKTCSAVHTHGQADPQAPSSLERLPVFPVGVTQNQAAATLPSGAKYVYHDTGVFGSDTMKIATVPSRAPVEDRAPAQGR